MNALNVPAWEPIFSMMSRVLAKPRIPCTVYDRYEGRVHLWVRASSDDEAHDEADIYAGELGLRNVDEIVVGIHE